MICTSIEDLRKEIFTKNDTLNCVCELCGKQFSLKLRTAKNKAKHDEKLLCVGCGVSYTKSKYTEDRKNEIKNKLKATCIEKYGVDTPLKTPKAKESFNTINWDERNKKSKATCIERYGVDNISKLEETTIKKRESSLKKYGVEHPSKLESVKNKQKETNLLKYESDCYLSSDIGKEKIKKYWIENFGVDNASELGATKDKISANNGMKNKENANKSIHNKKVY